MRQYLQIVIILAVFFLLVFLKEKKSDDIVSGMPLSSGSSPSSSSVRNGKYKNGTYIGSVEDAIYGNLQVQVVISGGMIVDITEPIYPNDNRTSALINTQALVYLKQEALQSQSAKVDIVSGASDSSPAFARSLSTALKEASL